MPRRFAVFCSTLCALVFPSASPGADINWRAAAVWKDKVFPVIAAKCVDCHDGDNSKGGVDLASLEKLPDARAALRLWWRVRDQVESGQMPPKKKGTLSPEESGALLGWIGDNEKFLRSGAVKDPGEHRLRRLNRTEYTFALRDLFGLPEEAVRDQFPDEGAGGEGFDNNGDTLFIAPVMAEKYVEAADLALKKVLADPAMKARLISAPAGPGRAALRASMRPWLRLAFRRKEDPKVLERYAGPGDRVLARGGSLEEAVALSAKAVLCSPDFLLIREQDRTDAPLWPVSPHELATRLSLFLWSSLPDAPLLEEADSGRLTDPAVLRVQMGRVLADPRARAFSGNFCGQWLQFEKLLTTADPDKGKYKFSEELRQSLYQEAVAFSDYVIRGDGNFLDLLDSNYAFLNNRLAEHYGLAPVEGEELRLVKLDDRARGGVLGMGAVLTATSLPRRTSPVLRGKWVLEQLFGTPPPAPPPNVGEIAGDDRTEEKLTVRQQLERHLRRDDCRGCHAKMDPLGFALENYDAVGRWRETLNDQPLDTYGKLPDGREFRGPVEMKAALLQDKDLFARNLCVKLLSYSLGRGIEAVDMPTVALMEDTLKQNGYRAGPLLGTIVHSLPFTHRRSRPIPIPLE